MGARLITAVVVVALALTGPLQSLAAAQQSVPAPNAPAPPEVSAAVTYDDPDDFDGLDAYDLGAFAMTIVGFPLKLVTCGVGAVIGAAVFVVTIGSADRFTATVVREGCSHNWIVSGRDIRPEDDLPSATQWEMR